VPPRPVWKPLPTPRPYGPDNPPPPPERPEPTLAPGPGIVSGKAEGWPWWLVPGVIFAIALAVLMQAGATRLLCP
jgi:hypothetical protein